MTEEQEQDLVDIKASFERDGDDAIIVAELGEARVTFQWTADSEEELEIILASVPVIFEQVRVAADAAEHEVEA